MYISDDQSSEDEEYPSPSPVAKYFPYENKLLFNTPCPNFMNMLHCDCDYCLNICSTCNQDPTVCEC